MINILFYLYYNVKPVNEKLRIEKRIVVNFILYVIGLKILLEQNGLIRM